jgi:hypothetical protein
MKQSNRSSYPLQHNIRLILLSLCVIFTTILLFELNPEYSNNIKSEVIDADLSPTDSGIDLKEFVFPEITAFNEIIERPLFNETRLPLGTGKPEQTVVDTRKNNTKVRNKQEQLSLNAVVMTPDKQIAIIQSGPGNDLQRVALGEAIEGWTLDDVRAHSIRLVKGKEIKDLELEIKNSAIKKTKVAKSKKDKQSESQRKQRSEITRERITAKNTDAETAKKEK